VIGLLQELAEAVGRAGISRLFKLLSEKCGIVSNLVHVETKSAGYDPKYLIHESLLAFHETSVAYDETICKKNET
jgi:hypothetical protein